MLQSIRLENFRSFKQSSFEFDRKTSVVGDNGAGKSNLLEAIRLLSVGKSFKTSRLEEALNFSEPYFRASLALSDDSPKSVEFFFGTQFQNSPEKERRLTVDSKETSWNDFWGKFPTVLFVPTDVELVTGPPQLRRRYIDALLWQTSIEFRQSHLELTRVLRERSALLFLLKINKAGSDELVPWNELLLKLSEKVRSYRLGYVEFLRKSLKSHGSAFTGGAEVEINYEQNKADLEAVYRDEVRLSQNLVGAHRDQLDIRFNDQSARRYTSRGQARAIILLLKISEAAYLKEETGREPLVLLDDMFSELDRPTAERLFAMLDDNYQVIASSIEETPLTKSWKRIDLP